jgi:hypothetical protein
VPRPAGRTPQTRAVSFDRTPGVHGASSGSRRRHD